LILIFTFVCYGMVGFASPAVAENVTLDINLDKTDYMVGETVVATISITDIPDSIIGKNFGAFQLYVDFDNTVLEYKSGEIKFGLNDADILDENSWSITPHQSQGMIVALCAPNTETYTFSEITDPIDVLELSFEVTTSTYTPEDLVSFGDQADGYDAIFVDGKNSGYNEIKCDLAKQSALASTYEYLMKSPTASFADGEVSATVTADVMTGKTAYLFIGLYDKDTDSLVKPAKMFIINDESTEIQTATFEDVVSAENLEVKYFLWKSLLNISPAFNALKYDFSINMDGGEA